jgi:metal-sulfur cluster biosynthetic enzyme
MELWKFGDWKSFISLELMAHLFGVPTPKDDIDGSMVSSIYYIEKDLPRIVKYCEKDVLTLANVFRKMRQEDLLERRLNQISNVLRIMKYTDEQIANIGENIIKALKTVFDPEIPVDIYELGLVYDVQISEDGDVKVVMTLLHRIVLLQNLSQEVKEKVAAVENVKSVDLELTFEPSWNKDMMSEEAKFELGILF